MSDKHDSCSQATKVALLPNHIRPLRRLKHKGLRSQLGVDFHLAKGEHGALAKAVLNFQHGKFSGFVEPAKAYADGLQLTVFVFGGGYYPLQAVFSRGRASGGGISGA